MEARMRIFNDIYPDLRIMLGLGEIRTKLSLTDFESLIKDAIKYNEKTYSGEIPKIMLSKFSNSSRGPLINFFYKKYAEFRIQKQHMMNDLGYINKGSLQMKQRQHHALMEASKIDKRRNLMRLSRNIARIPKIQSGKSKRSTKSKKVKAKKNKQSKVKKIMRKATRKNKFKLNTTIQK